MIDYQVLIILSGHPMSWMVKADSPLDAGTKAFEAMSAQFPNSKVVIKFIEVLGESKAAEQVNLKCRDCQAPGEKISDPFILKTKGRQIEIILCEHCYDNRCKIAGVNV